MKKNITKKFIILVVTTVIFSSLLVSVNSVGAESIFQKALKGLRLTANEGFGGNPDTDVLPNPGANVDPFVPALIVIINYLLTFTGILFFLILIYGGYLWMMARGNEDQISKAKKITREVIIGIIIIVLARIITEFVLSQISTTTTITG